MISIIIPTLNEAAAIDATLDAVTQIRGQIEVIVVDGGSSDSTCALAAGRGAIVLSAPRGRGQQLAAGAAVARGDVVWLLHGDTRPPADGAERIMEALSDPGVVGGNFSPRFDGGGHAARFVSNLYPYLRWFGLYYGDSAFFMRRADYEQAGGFRPFPIFEDLDLLRRLRRRGRFVHLPQEVVSSARRFEGGTFPLTFAWWTILQILYWVGVPPRLLGRLYAPIRGRSKRAAHLTSPGKPSLEQPLH